LAKEDLGTSLTLEVMQEITMQEITMQEIEIQEV
jgi:hypothetical protein